MSNIVSKPDHGNTLVEEGKATEPFQLYLDDIEEKFNSSLLGVSGVELPVYTVSTLPDVPDATKAFLIFVSDESGGAVPAFSDGTNWRRVTDRAVVS